MGDRPMRPHSFSLMAASALLAGAVLAGCAMAPPTPILQAAGAPAALTDPVGQGRIIAQANCGSCHATGATDASPNPASPPFREVAMRYPPENLAEALAEGIIVGHPKMPPFVLQPADNAALIAYLRSLRGGR